MKNNNMWLVEEIEKLDCEGAVRVYKECGGSDERLLGLIERKNEIILKLEKLIEFEKEIEREGSLEIVGDFELMEGGLNE